MFLYCTIKVGSSLLPVSKKLNVYIDDSFQLIYFGGTMSVTWIMFTVTLFRTIFSLQKPWYLLCMYLSVPKHYSFFVTSSILPVFTLQQFTGLVQVKFAFSSSPTSPCFASKQHFWRKKKAFPHHPVGCWQWCVVAGLTPARRNCNIISYWFLVDLPWSSHHSVMCSTRLLNEINSPPAKQKSNRTLWELNAITEWVRGTFVG